MAIFVTTNMHLLKERPYLISEMAVLAQNLTPFGQINTQIMLFVTFLIKTIAQQAKVAKMMRFFRHIWRLLL